MGDIRSILIVEDDTAFAEFVRAAVESLGHRARIVASGAEALDAFRDMQPDLVFLDLLLPQRDGFKVCEDIRRDAKGRTVPVIMMTGIYKKPSYEKEALERLQANEYLIKPFGVRELWGAIERHLGPAVLRGAARAGAPSNGWAVEETPLACQLAEHLRMKSDGVLFVRGSDATFVIYLREGAPIFVRSSDPSDRLDRVVARTTRVPEAAIAACLKESQESRGRKRLGDTLVERKLLSRDEVEIALQLQLRLILNRAFQLDKGQCLFVPGEHPTDEDVLLQASPRALLVRGARSTPPHLALQRLPPGSSTLVRAQGWEALIPDLNLKEDELRLLQLCDGATTVERFIAISSVAGHDGPRILLALQCAGLVTDIPASRAAARPRGSSDFDAGDWRHRPLGAVVAELFRRRATGRLAVTLREAEAPKVLWMREGDLVAVESERESDRLSHMLARMQVVDQPALDDVVAALGKGHADVLLVRTLIDRELLSPTEGYWAAVYQAHGAVHDELRNIPLNVEWTARDLDPRMVALPDVPTVELALNGIRTLDAGTVTELLPEGSRVVAVRDASIVGLPLSGAEIATLERLREPVDLMGFCAQASDASARARTVLALLWLGLVETIAPVVAEIAAPDATMAPTTMLPLDAPMRESAPAATSNVSDGSGFALVGREAEPAQDFDGTIPIHEAPAAEPAPVEEIAERLRDLRATLQALRSGFAGDEKRVQVDRRSMAALLDDMLELCALAETAATTQEPARKPELIAS